MRTESFFEENPSVPGVSAVETVSTFETAHEAPSTSRSTRFRSTASATIPPFRPTDRDRTILDSLFRYRLLTDIQLQILHFSLTNDTACERRLRRLYAHKWVDRLPRESVNAPYIYVLTRFATRGMRALRERYSEDEVRGHLTRFGSIPHHLAINDVRVRVARAVQERGWTLRTWLRSEDLVPVLGTALGIIPDAFFQIERWDALERRPRVASFFLEVQRAPRASRALAGKWQAYHRFYASGSFADTFGVRGLRVLAVFTNELLALGSARAQRAVNHIGQSNWGFLCFTGLDQLTGNVPDATLTAPVWWRPHSKAAVALFDDAIGANESP